MSRSSLHAADLRLYFVTDSALCGGIDAVPEVVLAAVRGGAGMIQLRDKQASDADLAELVGQCRRILAAGLGSRAAQIPLVVNDRLAVAEQTRCHLHVGQEDISPAQAREVLGEDLMIGLSTGTAEQVRQALAEGASDILGIGPIRATPTKADAAAPLGLDGLAACLAPWKSARRRHTVTSAAPSGAESASGRAAVAAGLPRTVAIGGIDATLASEIAATGIDGVCVVSAIATAADPHMAAATLLEAFDRGRAQR